MSLNLISILCDFPSGAFKFSFENGGSLMLRHVERTKFTGVID